MAVDICIIILTAFAIFGLYCLLETILEGTSVCAMPPSVTFMAKNTDNTEKTKLMSIWENTGNNKIVFIDENRLDCIHMENCEIYKIIKDVLFTKKT